MKRIYDVYFTLAQPAVIAIEANSEDEAMEKLQSMDGNELLRRIQNAIDFLLWQVKQVHHHKAAY